MRFILVILFTSLSVVSVMAERIIKREKYNLIIASDTVCTGENYDLIVDLKGNGNAIVLRNGSRVAIVNGKGLVKFMSSAYAYNKDGASKQRLQIGVVINNDSLFEDVTYVVVKPPMSNSIRRVQDSLTILLSKQEAYKDIHDASYYQKYTLGFASEFGNDVLKEELGQLLVLIVVDSNGKVIKYDIVKNTYKTIPLQKIQHALESYQFEGYVAAGNLKFSAVIYTVKGYRGNIIVASDR